MANVSKIRNIVLRLIIVVASWGFILKQVTGREHLSGAWDMLTRSFSDPWFWSTIVIILLLMMVNWLIEALKWQKLMEQVQKVSPGDAIKAVLTGITVSVFTPNRVGEFLGRVFSIRLASPLRAILATLVGSLSQLTITIILGSIGSLFFIGGYSNLASNLPGAVRSTVVVLTLAVDLAIVMFFLNVSFLTNFLRSIIPRHWRRLKSYVRVFSRFRRQKLLQILMMSLARYFVFSFQYLLLMRLFGISVPVADMLMLISVIWFVMAAIPSFALAELGIRSSVAVAVFSFYSGTVLPETGNTLAIVAASSLLWIINIAMPAVAGSVFINRLKLPTPVKSIFRP